MYEMSTMAGIIEPDAPAGAISVEVEDDSTIVTLCVADGERTVEVFLDHATTVYLMSALGACAASL